MADEKPAAPTTENTPPATPAAVPKSSDIVSDNHAKSIRTLEEKLSTSEKTTQDLRKELNDLQAIVKKASEVNTPVVTQQPETVLSYLEKLIFKKWTYAYF